MNRKDYRLTSRMERIFQSAEEASSQRIIEPHHLFIGACKEATGVCGELYLYLWQKLGEDFMSLIEKLHKQASISGSSTFHHFNISTGTGIVLDMANEKKSHFGQSLINEGHVIQSILDTEVPLSHILTEEIIQGIIQIACVPRDLIVNLNDFKAAHTKSWTHSIRRVDTDDLSELKSFIRSEFGERWIEHIDKQKMKQIERPIFIAQYHEEIIGFACYDIVRNRKGLFGPMGTSSGRRFRSVGKELLHRCLLEMADEGYEYAVIGEAGPIEFYEKACNAKLIPNF
ncbi:GNAT family N-acetyltransferase [Halobacillus sp. K22]|uniref:GNAT family N-acetyltransferase n=1 Tax=Halobacillus sp. K22 TaxID=3457431 RepID=UPI003FCDCC51